MQAKLPMIRPRDVVLLAVLLLALVGAVVWLMLHFADPAPPSVFVLSTASAGSPYHRYGEHYRAVFERQGVKLEVRESTGSVANLKALADPASGVHAAFVQGGISSARSEPDLLSLGRVAHEPLWVFHRKNKHVEYLSDLRGARLAVGEEGSGTRVLSLQLLRDNDVTAENSTLRRSATT